MSILLIGQRSRYRSSQRPPYHEEDWRGQKKNIQERYRLDLVTQMNENYQRRKKQRQLEIQLDRKYERLFYQQAAQLQNSLTYPHLNQKVEERDYRSEGRGVRHFLPPIDSYATNQKVSRLQTEPIEPKSSYIPPQRGRTIYHTQQAKPAQSTPLQMHSTQQRHKEMQEQLESKLKQVYQMMAESVKTLHNTQDLDNVGSKLFPISLGLQHPKYTVKYPPYVNPPQNNTEQDPNYFKLPNIAGSFDESKAAKSQSEAQWREWYAREKLREMENRYRKQLNVQRQNIRFLSRRGGNFESYGLG